MDFFFFNSSTSDWSNTFLLVLGTSKEHLNQATNFWIGSITIDLIWNLGSVWLPCFSKILVEPAILSTYVLQVDIWIKSYGCLKFKDHFNFL